MKLDGISEQPQTLTSAVGVENLLFLQWQNQAFINPMYIWMQSYLHTNCCQTTGSHTDRDDSHPAAGTQYWLEEDNTPPFSFWGSIVSSVNEQRGLISTSIYLLTGCNWLFIMSLIWLLHSQSAGITWTLNFNIKGVIKYSEIVFKLTFRGKIPHIDISSSLYSFFYSASMREITLP